MIQENTSIMELDYRGANFQVRELDVVRENYRIKN